MDSLFKDISREEIMNPQFEKKSRVHDFRNYYRERQIIITMAQIQADNEEWD
jgi:hypothetical protein